jgi:histidinol dehydrogenase
MRPVRYGTKEWALYLESLPRASSTRPQIDRAVAEVLRTVLRDGDKALVRYTARFDKV